MFNSCYKRKISKIHSNVEIDQRVSDIVNNILYKKKINKINRNIKIHDDEINTIFELPDYMQKNIIILLNEGKLCKECNVKYGV
jgi:hypothetical protein